MSIFEKKYVKRAKLPRVWLHRTKSLYISYIRALLVVEDDLCSHCLEEKVITWSKSQTMMTIDHLKSFEPEYCFACGYTEDPRLYDKRVKWMAIRGYEADWAIYYHLDSKPWGFIATQGDKCKTPAVIRELVTCTDEMFEAYRY